MAQKCVAAGPQEMTLYLLRFAAVSLACEFRRSCNYEIIISQCKSFTHFMHITYFTVFPYTESNFQLSNAKNWEKGQQRAFLQKNIREFFHEGKHRLVPPWCWDPNYSWCWKPQIWSIPYFVCGWWEFVYENPLWKFTLKLQINFK